MSSIHFKFVIPFFNCKNNIENTLFSIVSQSYKNWSALFIDDLSTDGSYELLEKTVHCLPLHHKEKISIQKNIEKCGEVVNTLNAVQATDDNTIIVRLDGGDWLVDNDILFILSQVYSDKDVDIAWTNHRWSYTNYNISGPINLMQGQTIYTHPWVTSHLKTFRCSRIKKVPKGNFLNSEGKYITIACDQAVFLPMIHTAISENKKLVYIPICAYHYDIDLANPQLFNQPRSHQQKESAEFIRARGFVQ